MSIQLEEKKVVKYILSTKAVSIDIADFENVVDGIQDEVILSQMFKVGVMQCACLAAGIHTRDARPTPPRIKTCCPDPTHKKQDLPRPALQKLTKPAGRSAAKLAVNSKVKI